MKKTKIIVLALSLASCTSLLKLSQSTPTTADRGLKLSPIWVTDALSSKNIGFRKVNRFSPTIYKGQNAEQIIVANGIDGLTSYNTLTQSIIWRAQINLGIESSGTLLGNRLYVGGNNGLFYSIDPETGAIVWSFDTKSEVVAEPTLKDNSIYFLTGSGMLFSLDATTGKQNWVYNRQDSSENMTIRGGSKPSIDKNIIYSGFSDGSLVALNSQTGTPQWEISLNKSGKFKDIDASPVLDQEMLFMNSFDDSLYAINKKSGSIIWKTKTGGVSTPLVIGDKLIYTNSKSEVKCVSKKDGSQIWSYNKVNGIATDPILFKGYVVVGESQGKLLFLDLLSGQVAGGFEPGRGILSRPSTDHEKVIYFISGEANFYGIQVNQKNDNLIPYIVN